MTYNQQDYIFKDYHYIKIGKLTETPKGWVVKIRNEAGYIQETFHSLDSALKHIEKNVRTVQEVTDIPISVEYVRLSGSKTFLCYKSKDEKPKDYAAFDYLGFNTAFHRNYERRTYITPRFINYNAIARVSAAELVKFRRWKNAIDALSLVVWMAFIVLAMWFSLNPTNEIIGKANILGLETNSVETWGFSLAFVMFATTAMLVDNIPRLVFWWTSRSIEEVHGMRKKSYGEFKEWKVFYRTRIFANWAGEVLLGLALGSLIGAAIEFNHSIYSVYDLHMIQTDIVLFLSVASTLLLVTQQGFLIYRVVKTRQERDRFLGLFLRKDLRQYFKAWSIFPGIQDEQLDFNFNIFVYKLSKEEMEDAYTAIKTNRSLSKSVNDGARRELEMLLENAFITIRNNTRTMNISNTKLLQKIKLEKVKIAKEEKKAKEERDKTQRVSIEFDKTMLIEAKAKKKAETQEFKINAKRAKALKKDEVKRLQKIKAERKRQAKIERERMKNGLYW